MLRRFQYFLSNKDDTSARSHQTQVLIRDRSTGSDSSWSGSRTSGRCSSGKSPPIVQEVSEFA